MIGPDTLAHASSEKMTAELNAKKPDWLTVGVPIKAESVMSRPDDQIVFHSRSGGATNSRNRVQIPSRGIQFELDYEIDWSGNNEAGTGVSLSPDGRKLIINAGPASHLFEIEDNGSYREVPLQLPNVTYDEGIKGYLRGWSWVDDKTLVAQSEIMDESAHDIIESRIYVFYTKEKTLTRLDISALKINKSEGIEVVGFANDLNHIKLYIGGKLVVAKADLKSPPEIDVIKTDPEKALDPFVDVKRVQPTPPEPKSTPTTTTSKAPASSRPWSIIAVLIVVASCLLWLRLKRRL